ncbi:hypothetical protein [Mariniplasma anaerobium]|uniref:Uncharacterized protein n=1 Tax=Mariniplasma anaerobium TaxID=2735436 RepID=A0A7U9TKY0_9MOLU|nr:hypothetical protein [Mariniplasma anaerobium]BCR36689.1 hypothetical protein MPAN_015820 [Mariniplasma anaerobium]
MKTYRQFHGEIFISEIGKELRDIVKSEKSAFKILTGYGSTGGTSSSKHAALKSLRNMKKQGLIKGYCPGEVKNQLLSDTSPFYETKSKYESILKNDSDFGNDGIIFVFIK